MEILLLTDIVIILGLAVIVLLLFHFLRLPAIVGFLLTGIIAGPHGFGFVGAVHEVEVLAEVGVILLLFTIGIEFSFQRLLEIKKQVIIGGSFQVFFTILSSYAIATRLGFPTREAIFIGFLISLSSTAIVLRLIQQRAEVDAPHGRAGLGILLFQDVIIVPMIIVTPLLAGNNPAGMEGEFIFFLAEGLGIIALILMAAKWFIPWLLYQVARTGSKELFLLCVVSICLVIAWLTSSVGLSLALGAFIAGIIISESEYNHQALFNILPFRDVFTSFFFVSIGMLLDTSFLVANLVVIFLVSVGVLLLKSAVSVGASILLGLPLRSAILAGLSICQVGEFSFILSKVGLGHGLLSDNYQLFLSATVVTMAATPFIIGLAPRIADLAICLPLPGKLKAGLLPEPPKEMARKLKHHLVVIGYGFNGRNVAHAAKMTGIPYLIIEMLPDTVKSARKNGEPIFYGDANHEEILRHASIEDSTVVVIAINDPTSTRRITENVRKLAKKAHLIVRTRFLKEMETLYKLGADDVIPEEFETSVEIFARVLAKYLVPRDKIEELVVQLRADGYEKFRSHDRKSSSFSQLDLHLQEVEVTAMLIKEGSPLAGKSLAELELRKKHGVTILATRREEATITNLETEMTFEAGDILYMMGAPDRLAKIARLFSKTEDGDDAFL
ncbi:cation:proton antiporter domain-containing protein [Desulfogranum mediterraneum]|uniref:cation:proton antiporter domain-containing protein n=1 Tax=Desulfogranum mediterraneum TaxID=160661 RepID=UPI00041DFB78|nr:cation:proton antiporter [Desulfogranum mediterraneum]